MCMGGGGGEVEGEAYTPNTLANNQTKAHHLQPRLLCMSMAPFGKRTTKKGWSLCGEQTAPKPPPPPPHTPIRQGNE